MPPEEQIFSRRSMLARFKQEKGFELVIIGGGIHGATLARQASQLGLRCLLLEKHDFGYGLSSRSSKMLHGGVRYLEHGHVGLVREALAERSFHLLQAPHLCRVQKFLFPTLPRSSRPSWQMRIGLAMYDLLARLFSPKSAAAQSDSFTFHRRIQKGSHEWRILEAYGMQPKALLQYSDGQMDDTRIVIENCIAASRDGACLLNKSEVRDIKRADNSWEVKFVDHYSGQEQSCRGEFLVNFAGPWVKQVHQCWKPWKDDWPQPVYVRGTHLLFDFTWPTDGLIVPTKESGRYYFVWPYFSAAGNATLVGPTSVLCPDNEDDCQASEEEISELLGYLQEDFPYAGFTTDRMTKAFAGMRILAGPPKSHIDAQEIKASEVSRDDVLIEEDGYLALLGGKYTTSRKTAESVLGRVLDFLANSGRDLQEARQRLASDELSTSLLPGALEYSSLDLAGLESELIKHFALENLPRAQKEVHAAVQRFGTRAKYLLSYPLAETAKANAQGLEMLLAALTRFCVELEGACDRQGVLSRLGWDDFPQLTAAYLPVINEELYKLQEYLQP